MKQKIKKILSLLIIAICSINLGGQTVMAANSSYLMPQKETVFTSDNSVINEYYTEFYAGEKEVMVTDSNGNDVTTNFLDSTIQFYNIGDFESIKRFAAVNGYRLHLLTETEAVVQPFALEQYKMVSDTIIEYYTDTQFGTVMEFMGTLKGGIWYNPNTYQVTRTSSPTFNVELMNVPIGIVPSCNNIQTGSNVSGGRGYFYATYTLSGVYVDESGVWGVNYDFGTHTFSFYATA